MAHPDVPVKSVDVNYSKILFWSLAFLFINWIGPLLCGKYADTSFDFVPASDIPSQLIGLIGSSVTHEKWCPHVPTQLDNRIKIPSNFNQSFDIAQVKNYQYKDGAYSPRHCQSRYRIALIVPYRDRLDHLEKFLAYMHPYLMKQQLEYKIIVVEQADKKPFNRGKLLNVGFLEAQKMTKIDCVIFHDVDLLPVNEYNMYACTHMPRHMYSAIDTFRFRLPYRELCGGTIAILARHFNVVNGFSNQFSGWGGEDDDFCKRLAGKQLEIVRFDPAVAVYVMLPHSKTTPDPQRMQHLQSSLARSDVDGLNSAKYEVLSIDILPLYVRLLITL
ncbi:beta-1,4-N-acetylgalactosaminyltransferase bre-4-like isoform X1 [Oratosquilla oratoria]|uniref:beta-1,4-N-acetylgalactosaminyltransferase bre-4-like isoform X1 n=1 Tax=Oratosquilla oratoria TaxID=337810 RepID=UPI003F758E07